MRADRRRAEAPAHPGVVLVVVAAAVVLGVGLRFYHLDGKVFWEDEIFGAMHMLGYQEAEIVESSPRLVSAGDLQRYFKLPEGSDRRGLGATVTALATEVPQHPPLYYLAARLWAGAFGTSTAALRSLAAVFGVFVLLCVYLLCLELFASREVALIAVALLAVSPFYVLYSQEARDIACGPLRSCLRASSCCAAAGAPDLGCGSHTPSSSHFLSTPIR